jgi:hypothetical protein
MARKLERARVQAREAAAIEFTKLYYLMQPSKRELRARVFSFDGVIRRFSSKPLRQRRTRWSGEPRSNFDCTGGGKRGHLLLLVLLQQYSSTGTASASWDAPATH